MPAAAFESLVPEVPEGLKSVLLHLCPEALRTIIQGFFGTED